MFPVVAARAREKGLVLTCEIAPDVPNAVLGDPTRLRQVLLNLLVNAGHALQEGGGVDDQVTVTTSLDAEGRVVVLSQRTRDRQRNLEDARAKLGELIQRALVAPTTRRATRPTRAAARNRLEEKRRNAQRKLGRAIPRD